MKLKSTIQDGWLAGQLVAGVIGIDTNSAHQLGFSWDYAGLSLVTVSANSSFMSGFEIIFDEKFSPSKITTILAFFWTDPYNGA